MSLATYLGLPLLDWSPDWEDPSRTMMYVQAKNQLGSDNAPGPLAFDAPHMPRPRTTFRLRYILETREDMNAARDFLCSTAIGRWKTFWVPLWLRAFQLTADVDAADTTFTITQSGYSRWYAGAQYGREHLAFFPRVPTVEQTLIGRKVSDSVDNGDGTETLTISSALGDDLKAADVVCFLLLCRLDTDSPVLEWDSMNSGILEIPLIDVPMETP